MHVQWRAVIVPLTPVENRSQVIIDVWADTETEAKSEVLQEMANLGYNTTLYTIFDLRAIGAV